MKISGISLFFFMLFDHFVEPRCIPAPSLCPLHWHCLQHPACLPHSCILLSSSPHLGSWPEPGRVPVTWCQACDASLGPPPLRKCSQPFSHPGALLWRVKKLQLNPETIPKHSWLIPTAAWLWVPTRSKDMPHFQMDWSIKMWTTKRRLSSTIANYHAHSPPPPSIPFVVHP